MEKKNKKTSPAESIEKMLKPDTEKIESVSGSLTVLMMDEKFQKEASRIVNESKLVDIEEESKIIEAKKEEYGKESLTDDESTKLSINDIRKGKFKDFFEKAINMDSSKITKIDPSQFYDLDDDDETLS